MTATLDFSRRSLIVLVVCMAGCGSDGDRPPQFPAAAAGWTLEAGQRSAAPRAKVRVGWTVTYAGKPTMTVTVYRMAGQASAFEAVQSWRAESGKLPFFKGPYLVIVESPGAEFRTLSRFATALQAEFPER